MSGFIQTYRGTVAPDQCDHLGHMNVQHYVSAISDAAFSLMTEIGLGPRRIEELRLGIAAVHMDISYLQEINSGAVIFIESAIGKIDGKKITFLHRMTEAESGIVAMKAKVLGVGMCLDERKSMALPSNVLEKARTHLADESEW